MNIQTARSLWFGKLTNHQSGRVVLLLIIFSGPRTSMVTEAAEVTETYNRNLVTVKITCLLLMTQKDRQ